jgi:hypothetical protein
MPKNTEPPTVRVNSVWADNDKRCEGRRVRVVEIDATHATVVPVDIRARYARRTRIRLDRFRPTSTGYRLVSDAPEEG